MDERKIMEKCGSDKFGEEAYGGVHRKLGGHMERGFGKISEMISLLL